MDLLIVVPARSRPQNVQAVLDAWDETHAWEHADLCIEVDADDPALPGFLALELPAGARLAVHDVWRPMVHKLETAVARELDNYFAIGFAGDDHHPRTVGWAKRYLDELRSMGTGIVYGDDGYQHENTPTQWAMTTDIVRAVGRMVPAPVEHMYCDDALRDLGKAAGCLRYLPDVLIEHMHPAAQKAAYDDQYRRVNAPEQYRRDKATYQRWLKTRLEVEAAMVAEMHGGARPLWTILIPTLGQRRELLERLLDRLMPQVDEAGGAVQILAYWNNGEQSLPEIRQRLIEAVNTPYLSFVDDDDLVEPDFVPAILEALRTGPDFVGFNVQCYTDNQPQGVAYHSLQHRRWREVDGKLLRDISHINPMRTKAAKAVTFRIARPGQPEDRMWVQQLRARRLLKAEVVIDRVLYHYLWSDSTSAWRRPSRSIRKGDWEPLRPESPHFAYHQRCAAA